jgi:hypothetical protein
LLGRVRHGRLQQLGHAELVTAAAAAELAAGRRRMLNQRTGSNGTNSYVKSNLSS